MVQKPFHPIRQLLVAIGLSSLASVILFLLRTFISGNYLYWFLLWNLCLAWVPFVAAGALVYRLRYSAWSAWINILLTIVWLSFLPNSFYMASDLVHLRQTSDVSLMYDAALFLSFVLNGLLLGFTSLFAVHWELTRRFTPRATHWLVGAILVLCGYGVYLGRYLRWNTWDIITHPAELLFNMSDVIIHPYLHVHAFTTTGIYFVLLGSMYMVVWQLAKLVRFTRV